MRYTALARAAWGGFLLLAPGAATQIAGEAPDRASTVVGRVLGLRHLAQALLLERTGTRKQLLVGAAIDAAHALSMAGLAALSRSYRRPAALDAALAAGWAINGIRGARNV